MNLYDKILAKTQRILNVEIVRTRYNGYTIFHHRSDSLIGEINKVHDRIYESSESQVICDELNKHSAPVLLDIGANIGLMSLNVVRGVKNVHIYAVEPGPYQWKFLNKNIRHNRLQQVIETYPVAFGRTNGKVRFHSHGTSDSSGDGFVDTGRAGASTEIEVDCLTLDQWWQDRGNVMIHFLKLDTEGAELEVLAGGQNFLKACRPTMMVEICHLNYIKYGLTFDDYFEFFQRQGYTLLDVETRMPVQQNNTDLVTGKYSYLAVYDEED
jgi:FkbM family methyltransferase